MQWKEVIETHLYLEEWLAGDDLVTVESIRLHMTKSITAVDGALNGMSHDSGYPGIAPTDDELLKSLRAVQGDTYPNSGQYGTAYSQSRAERYR